MSRFGLRRRGSARDDAATPERPILAVDVDGVVSLFGFDDPPAGPEAEFELIEGTAHCVSVAAGERLQRLAVEFELIWASGWEERANHFSARLGLPELPYLTFAGSVRFGSADWKLEPLREYARGRSLAWLDDSFDAGCYEWARQREEPTLLVATDSAEGLQEVQVEALLGWARSLGAEGSATPPR